MEATETKFFGVILGCKMKWSSHPMSFRKQVSAVNARSFEMHNIYHMAIKYFHCHFRCRCHYHLIPFGHLETRLWPHEFYSVHILFFSNNGCANIDSTRPYSCSCFNSSPPWTKRPPFRRRYFQTHFRESKVFLFWLKFHWRLFLMVQLTITQHWFR